MKWKNSHKLCMLWEVQQDVCHAKKVLLVFPAVSMNSKKIGLWKIITMGETFSCKDCKKKFVLSRYGCFWFQWQDIHTIVLAEIKWKTSHTWSWYIDLLWALRHLTLNFEMKTMPSFNSHWIMTKPLLCSKPAVQSLSERNFHQHQPKFFFSANIKKGVCSYDFQKKNPNCLNVRLSSLNVRYVIQSGPAGFPT